jgi:deferrochelatase/peroxidase EfeB
VSEFPAPDRPAASRRGFLAAAAGAMAGVGAEFALRNSADAATTNVPTSRPAESTVEPFFGPRQGGILTPLQNHTYFAAFDLTAAHREDVVELLQTWTTAAARLAAGLPAETISKDIDQPAADTGETMGLPPSRLTITFGFGPGLFIKQGKDRYGLASRRPPALIDLPAFSGDQLVQAKTGGDLSIQACADDPQVAFHAVRQLSRLAYDSAQLRWAQTGFLPSFAKGQTPRNLLGFKDGTNNPATTNSAAMEKFVFIGDEGPAWMRGGSYLVMRKIRLALEHWDRMNVKFQEQTLGRQKYAGAPLNGKNEFDAVDVNAVDKDGNAIYPDTSHVSLANPANNNGARILRRPYSYNDGVNFTSERWPPWRQGMEYDAGLLFISYQRDVRSSFVPMFDKMSKLDMLNQFATHVGGGFFAIPRGVSEGQWIGQGLFEKV